MNPREQRFEASVIPAGGRVLSYLSRRTQVPADAADLLSEVLLIAWRKIDDLPEDPNDVAAWLIGVARRVLANQKRGQVRRRALADRLREYQSSLPPLSAPSTEAVAIKKALWRLNPRDRELLMLAGWDQLTSKEIAIVLSGSPPAIRQRLARARKRFRKQLQLEGVVIASGDQRPPLRRAPRSKNHQDAPAQ